MDDVSHSIVLVSTVEDLVFNGEREKTYEHVGIGYLASYMRSKGYFVKILYVSEFEANDTAVERILSTQTLLIGFNAYAVTIKKVLELCALVKEKENIHICLGGQTPTFEDENILRGNPAVNSIVRGEGELTFFELAESLRLNKALEGIDGLSYMKKGEYIKNQNRVPISDLNQLPWPARDNHEVINKNTFTIESSRGCLGRCSFCTAHHSDYYGQKEWRGRSPNNVVEEISYLVKNYDAQMFNFVDASFEDPGEKGKERIAQIAKLIIEKGLQISFVADFRAESLTEKDSDLLDLLIQAGLEGVVLGLESGNEDTLRLFNKHATVEDNKNIVKLLQSKRLGFMHNMIMFQPYITTEGLKDNVKLLKELNLAYRFEDFQTRLQLQPGIELNKKMVQDGLISEHKVLTSDILDYQYLDSNIKEFSVAMASLIKEENLEMEFFDLNMQIFNLRLVKEISSMKEVSSELWSKVSEFERNLDSCRRELTNSNCKFVMEQIELIEQKQWTREQFQDQVPVRLIEPTIVAKQKMRGHQKQMIKYLVINNIDYKNVF